MDLDFYDQNRALLEEIRRLKETIEISQMQHKDRLSYLQAQYHELQREVNRALTGSRGGGGGVGSIQYPEHLLYEMGAMVMNDRHHSALVEKPRPIENKPDLVEIESMPTEKQLVGKSYLVLRAGNTPLWLSNKEFQDLLKDPKSKGITKFLSLDEATFGLGNPNVWVKGHAFVTKLNPVSVKAEV